MTYNSDFDLSKYFGVVFGHVIIDRLWRLLLEYEVLGSLEELAELVLVVLVKFWIRGALTFFVFPLLVLLALSHILNL